MRSFIRMTTQMMSVRVAMVSAGLAMVGLPAEAAYETIFLDGFEASSIDLEHWNPQVYDHDGGAVLVTVEEGGAVRSGKQALRIKLAVDDDTDPGGKHRSELRPRRSSSELSYRAPYGLLHRYAFSLYLPEDWSPDAPEIVAQWHGRPDRDEFGADLEPLRSPPMALRMTYIQVSEEPPSYVPAWEVLLHWDDTRYTPEDKSTVRLVRLTDPTDATGDLGRWVDWVFEVRWSYEPEGKGRVRVWRDGAQVVDYVGPNAFNDDLGPNSKIGIYKWIWPTSSVDLRVAYYDDVSIERQTTALPAVPFGGLVLGSAGLCVWALTMAMGACRRARPMNRDRLRPTPKSD
ncbi:polysaccharide lyase [Myxococcota bacterium]|nr:polysaccharide lyase [Myxococcota bacterium]